MIQAEFYRHGDAYKGVHVSGHAGFAEYGFDIVCAGVSSALQLTVNAICEVLGIDAKVSVLENEIELLLPDTKSECAQSFLRAFALQLSLLSENYENTINITDTEV